MVGVGEWTDIRNQLTDWTASAVHNATCQALADLQEVTGLPRNDHF